MIGSPTPPAKTERELNFYCRLFNSMEKAVTDHKDAKAGVFEDDADAALHRKHGTIMKIACKGPDG